MARRDDREYREYLSEEQRSQRGCIAPSNAARLSPRAASLERLETIETVTLGYRDDDRTPVIYCIREMALQYYGIDVRVVKIKGYEEFEAAIFSGAADVLIDHVEFLYREAFNGKKITFFCAPKIVRGLELVVPSKVDRLEELAGKTMAVRDSGRPHAITLWLRMVGLEESVRVVIVKDSEVGRWAQWKKVSSGECIACFVDPLYVAGPLQAGLKILAVPDVPVIGHYAQACTSAGLNPMTVWDLHWVKELDDEGFIDGLVKRFFAAG